MLVCEPTDEEIEKIILYLKISTKYTTLTG